MTISARSIALSADFSVRSRLAMDLPPSPSSPLLPSPARPTPRTVRPGAYDGTWNVIFATQAGNCSSTNSVPFAVAGTRVSSAGGGKVTGGISRGRRGVGQHSVGASVASGSGRLVGNSGSGRWSGIITGDRCSGSWQATRS